jgi:hypothetical protein
LYGGVGYRKVAGRQQRFGVINPAFKQPAVGRLAEAGAECARKVTH